MKGPFSPSWEIRSLFLNLSFVDLKLRYEPLQSEFRPSNCDFASVHCILQSPLA